LFAVLLVLTTTPVLGASRFAALIVDDASGRALYSDHADEPRHPASLVKLMTLFEVFRELEAGRLKLSDKITISAKAAGQPPSSLGLEAGQTLSVEQAIRALALKSANDAAVAVAEKVSGSERVFVRRMNKRAQFLGLRGTVFRNASGLYAPGQKTTARDMARLARTLRHRFPRYYHYFSERWFRVNGVGHGNHNSFLDNYPNADGLKTGFIGASGYNLAASAKRGGFRLVGVVLGAESPQARNQEMGRLFDREFRRLGAPTVRHRRNAHDRLPTAPKIRALPFDVQPSGTPVPASRWSVAIGDFADFDTASAHARAVQRSLPSGQNGTVAVRVPAGGEKSRFVAYLNGLDQDAAKAVCAALEKRALPCQPVERGTN